MNAELHHMWNVGRDLPRKSNKESSPILKEQLDENKVMLRQIGPRQGKRF